MFLNTVEGVGGSLPLSTARMTTTLESHVRAVELPSHCTMHPFGVESSAFSKTLTGTVGDVIMKQLEDLVNGQT